MADLKTVEYFVSDNYSFKVMRDEKGRKVVQMNKLQAT